MRLRAALTAAALLAGSVLVAAPAAATGETVTGAELAWGVSGEATNAAEVPGTVDLLAAGAVRAAGPDGVLTAEEWSAEADSVRIEQQRPDGSWAPATWTGLRATPDGVPLSDPAEGSSGARAVFTGGTGTVDPAAGTAELTWTGSLTLVTADGQGLVTVTDPQLTVSADGTGRLTALAGGTAHGVAAADREVTLAELSGVLVTASGLSAVPVYGGVSHAAPSGAPPQDTADPAWGAFPASFVDLQQELGQGAAWYSTGAATDPAKVPAPLHLELPAEAPETPAPAPGPSGGVPVTDAQFRWGVNQETGNAAFEPGTGNLLSAGRVPDAGPGQQITEARWAATAGAVRIEKRQPDGSYALATFAGLRTTSTGAPITSPTAGLTSDHQVVIDGGTGTVDAAAGAATIRWDGEFTVVFYSGRAYFTVADPVLTVSAGIGRVTATLGGFGADMADASAWVPLPETEVVLADLGPVQLTGSGFVATPAYAGVTYDPPAGSGASAQLRTGPSWGSFPRSFVDFQVGVGLASYWYSSGGPTDRYKVPLPVTVSFSADQPVAVPAPVAGLPPAAATPSNAVLPAPLRSTAPAAAPSSPARPGATATAASTPAPADGPAELLAGSTTVQVGADRTDLAGLLLPIDGPRDLGWWGGGALMVLAALVVWLRSTGRLVSRPRRTDRL